MSFIFALTSFFVIGTSSGFSMNVADRFSPTEKGFHYENVPTLHAFSSSYIEEDPDALAGNSEKFEECQALLREKKALLVQRGVDIILDEVNCEPNYLYIVFTDDNSTLYHYRYAGRIFFLN